MTFESDSAAIAEEMFGWKPIAYMRAPVGSSDLKPFRPIATPEAVIGNAMLMHQAMVKVVRHGGIKAKGGLAKQMAYIAKKGTVEVERATGDAGPDVLGSKEAVIKDWEADFARADPRMTFYTYHLIVSYPRETDDAAACVAAQDFAARLAGGDYGDQYKYMIAHHRDTPNPHAHVIINRIGEDGRTLQINRQSISTGDLRQLHVETARDVGVNLNATSRFSRGIDRRSIAIGRVKAEQEGRGFDRALEPKKNDEFPFYGAGHRGELDDTLLSDAKQENIRNYQTVADSLRSIAGKSNLPVVDMIGHSISALKQGKMLIRSEQMAKDENRQQQEPRDKKRAEAISDAFQQEYKSMRQEGMPDDIIGGYELEMRERAQQRIDKNPELIAMSLPDRRELEALEKDLLTTADFMDGGPGDAKLQQDRQDQFEAFAVKSTDHAVLASRAWDAPTNALEKPDGYLTSDQREQWRDANEPRETGREPTGPQNPREVLGSINDDLRTFFEGMIDKVEKIPEEERRSEAEGALSRALQQYQPLMDEENRGRFSKFFVEEDRGDRENSAAYQRAEAVADIRDNRTEDLIESRPQNSEREAAGQTRLSKADLDVVDRFAKIGFSGDLAMDRIRQGTTVDKATRQQWFDRDVKTHANTNSLSEKQARTDLIAAYGDATGIYKDARKDIRNINRADIGLERTDPPADSRFSPAEQVADQLQQPSQNQKPNVRAEDQQQERSQGDKPFVVTGVIKEIGEKLYRENDRNSSSPYITVTQENGKDRDVWGVAMPDVVERYRLKEGDRATLTNIGQETVEVQQTDPKTGERITVMAERRAWEASNIVRATRTDRQEDRFDKRTDRDDDRGVSR